MRQHCTYNRQSISVGSLYNKEQYNGSQIFLLAMILQQVLSRITPPLLDILTMESLATYVEHPLKNSKHDNMDGILNLNWMVEPKISFSLYRSLVSCSSTSNIST